MLFISDASGFMQTRLLPVITHYPKNTSIWKFSVIIGHLLWFYI